MRSRSALAILFLAVATSGAACATTRDPGTAIDGGALAERVARASDLEGAYQVVFDWELTEPGARIAGQGVARVEPPARARLDLFSDRGERVSVAALVEDELRLPAQDQTELPPPAFLWASLGVFLPGTSAPPEDARDLGNGRSELRYGLPNGETLVYRFNGERIEEMEARRNGRTTEELRLASQGEPFPQEATYRDLEEVRELRITLESVEDAESHPTEIWDP